MTTTHHGFSATRRLILQGAGAVALIGLGNIPFGLAPAFAAANDKYPEEAFKQKSDADAIKALYGKTAEASDKVKLDAPEIAENGAVVPIGVSTTLADVTSISFLVSENPNALVASYRIPAGTLPSVANRVTARSCWGRSCIVFCTKPALITTVAPSGRRAGMNAQVPGPLTSSRT